MVRVTSALAMTLAMLCCLTARVGATPLRFAGGGTGGLVNIDIEKGSYPDKRVQLTPTLSVDFVLDPVASTIFFPEVKAAAGPFTSVQTENFLVPGSFTERRTITTTLEFDRFEVVATNVGPLALSSNVGTTFDIEEYRSGDRGGFTSATLTGHYTVQGPTQMYSGAFSVTISAAGRPWFGTDHSIIDVGAFPTHADIDLSPTIYLVNFQDFPLYKDIFNGTVDGVPIDVRMLRVEVQFDRLTADAVPEPATGALALVAGFHLARRRRRRP
jgi:hypothetical protein